MKNGRLLAIAAVATVVALGGCRNPFNPSARIKFDRFYCGQNSSPVLSIQQTQAGTMRNSITNLPDLLTRSGLINDTTVTGRITGYSVVYRQLSDGLPIASCGGAAGRRFQTHMTITGMQSNYASNNYIQPYLMIVTDELLNHIATNLSTVDGGIDCEVTFYGEDDNGYDIQVEGVLHIDVL